MRSTFDTKGLPEGGKVELYFNYLGGVENLNHEVQSTLPRSPCLTEYTWFLIHGRV